MNVYLVSDLVGRLKLGAIPARLGANKSFPQQSFMKLLDGPRPVQRVLVEGQVHLLMFGHSVDVLIEVKDLVRLNAIKANIRTDSVVGQLHVETILQFRG